MRTWKILVMLCFSKAVILVQSCTVPDKESKDHNLNIVATTTHVSDIVERLAGEHCKVISLMGPGVDPHIYKPTAKDISAISSADLIIYHGLRLEGKFGAYLAEAQKNQIKTYSVCSVLAEEKLLTANEGDTEHPDPHVWFSPELWIECMVGVAKLLSKELPSKSSEIISNSEQIKKEWKEVSNWATSQFETIPNNRRVLVTSHDAFQYFGNYYDIEVVALQGISTAQEAGLADRTNLVDFINKRRVRCLFVESSVNPKALKEIAKETGISIGSPLYSDTLGPGSKSMRGPGQKTFPCDSWSGMTIHNVSSIIEGFTR